MSTNLYGNMTPTPETTILDPERGRSHDEGLIVRTATYFQFVDKQTGEYVTPFYEESTEQFWQGVRMICLVAPLVGRSRNIIQAGYWGVNFADLHFVLMEIDDLTEYIFWVHTKKYAYAIQEAAQPYQETWGEALPSWQRGHGGRSGVFKVVDRRKPQPSWWSGKLDWAALQAYEEGGDDEEEEEDSESEGGEEDGNGKGAEDKADTDTDTDADADDKGGDDEEEEDDNGGKGRGKGKSKAEGNSKSRGRKAQDLVTPRRQSLRSMKATSSQAKGKARATTPEESHAAGSASPVASGSTRKRATVGQAGPSRIESNRPAKKLRVALTPNAESPVSVLPEGLLSTASPSCARPSRVDSLGVGPSAPGPSALEMHQPPTTPTSPPSPTPRRAPDEDRRPLKRARISPPPGNNKGKQKAEPVKQPAADASTPAPAPPRDSAPSVPGNDQGATSSKIKVTFQEWQARARQGTSVSHQTDLQNEDTATRWDNSTSQKSPPRAPVGSAPEVPVYGPFPPPTSSPLTPLMAWTTRPLTQVTPPTPPRSIEAANTSGAGQEPGEVDMSVSSAGSEGATEQDLTVPAESPHAHLNEAMGLPLDLVSRAETMLSEATDVLRRTGSTGTANPTIPADPVPMPSAAAARILELEGRLGELVQHSTAVLQRTAGSTIEVGPLMGDQTNTQSALVPSIHAGTSQEPSVDGPSTEQGGQVTPPRPEDVVEIGNRMSDLDLANRAPVRTRRETSTR